MARNVILSIECIDQYIYIHVPSMYVPFSSIFLFLTQATVTMMTVNTTTTTIMNTSAAKPLPTYTTMPSDEGSALKQDNATYNSDIIANTNHLVLLLKLHQIHRWSHWIQGHMYIQTYWESFCMFHHWDKGWSDTCSCQSHNSFPVQYYRLYSISNIVDCHTSNPSKQVHW